MSAVAAASLRSAARISGATLEQRGGQSRRDIDGRGSRGRWRRQLAGQRGRSQALQRTERVDTRIGLGEQVFALCAGLIEPALLAALVERGGEAVASANAHEIELVAL